MAIFVRALRAAAPWPSALIVLLAVWLVALATLWMLPTARLSETATNFVGWTHRAPFLVYALVLPTAWIVLSMRTRWPFFGPGDEGLAIVHTHAARPVVVRAWSCAGIVVAATLLQSIAGLSLGAVLATSSTPEYRVQRDVAARGDRYLVRTGQSIEIELPATSPGARLRLEPLSGFGIGSLKVPVTYELRSPENDTILPFTLRESLDRAVVALGEHPAGTWRLVRTGGDGTASDFLSGLRALEDSTASPLVAAMGFVFSLLPKLLVVVALALLLARFVDPVVHLLTMLGVTILGVTVSSDLESASDMLARGAVPSISSALSLPLLITLAGIVLGAVLVPYSIRRGPQIA